MVAGSPKQARGFAYHHSLMWILYNHFRIYFDSTNDLVVRRSEFRLEVLLARVIVGARCSKEARGFMNCHGPLRTSLCYFQSQFDSINVSAARSREVELEVPLARICAAAELAKQARVCMRCHSLAPTFHGQFETQFEFIRLPCNLMKYFHEVQVLIQQNCRPAHHGCRRRRLSSASS